METILIVDQRVVLGNGDIQWYRKQYDLAKPSVRREGSQYIFNSKLLKSWIEKCPSSKN